MEENPYELHVLFVGGREYAAMDLESKFGIERAMIIEVFSRYWSEFENTDDEKEYRTFLDEEGIDVSLKTYTFDTLNDRNEAVTFFQHVLDHVLDYSRSISKNVHFMTHEDLLKYKRMLIEIPKKKS